MATSKSWVIIDGGGTQTKVALVVSGHIVERGLFASYKPLTNDLQTDAVCAALSAWLAPYKLEYALEAIDYVVIGMSGVWGQFESQNYMNAFTDSWMRYLNFKVPRMSVISDVELVRLAALGASIGTVLIAGTGSIALGVLENGEMKRCGGWGPVADDVGSGSWLGIQAVRAVMRMLDGRGPVTLLLRPVALHLRVNPLQVDELQGAIRTMNYRNVARLAISVLSYADEGDNVARDIRIAGAKELALLVRTVLVSAPELQTAPVVLYGSLFNDKSYKILVSDFIHRSYSCAISQMDDVLQSTAEVLSATEL
ncbi:MAG: hypothetical protein HQ472_00410 [Ignavibacteria bacterium]|nr:hypothetical protein [Ignavibacteria bacterium]